MAALARHLLPHSFYLILPLMSKNLKKNFGKKGGEIYLNFYFFSFCIFIYMKFKLK
jgi:hypothetical protein